MYGAIFYYFPRLRAVVGRISLYALKNTMIIEELQQIE